MASYNFPLWKIITCHCGKLIVSFPYWKVNEKPNQEGNKMTEQKLTKKEIEKSLQDVQDSEQKANTLLKADNKLIAIGSISYGLSVFSFGYAGQLNIGSLSGFIALAGFFGFAIIITLIHRKHQSLGVTQRQAPKTLAEFVKTSLYAAFFAFTYAGGFYLKKAGFDLAPAICGVLATAVLATCMYYFPNFPLSAVQGKDSE